MPSYAPLPNIDLDPRTEAELVQAAARRVYEASGSTLNDFSSGSPIMALLEGQAFAQAEFLQFANQFPESVLVEWIGPFLGAQRRIGAGAVVDITFTINPRDDQFDVFEGYQVSTDPGLTNGESIGFVTIDRLIIPAGRDTGKVRAVALFRGANTNVPLNTITRSNTSLSGVISVTNEQAAAGGQDPELLSEVKERFFSLIRRRNPVSAEDWQDFFSDALGPGTSVTVLPRRSERDSYRYGGPYENNLAFGVEPTYGGDYIRTNPSVAFFVLNPDGTPITNAQQGALTNLLRWSLPIEFLGFVYPMEVDNTDFVLDIQYDPTKGYAQNLLSLSQTIRNNLFTVMTPNVVFPIEYEQSVTDVEGALNTTFPLTLGTTNQYIDPDITSIKAYHPPLQISISEFERSTPVPFESGATIQKDDLVVVQGIVEQTFYPALESFTPQNDTRDFSVNTGDLDLELIQVLEVGSYTTGDVVSDPATGEIHVVLVDFDFNPSKTLDDLIRTGFLSIAKAFTPWVQDTFDPINTNGVYDPQVFAFVQGDTRTTVYVPPTPQSVAENKRPGYPIYVTNQEFTVAPNTTSLGTAQSEGLVSSVSIPIKILTPGETYIVGDYVKTPSVSELTTGQITRESCYLDPVNGLSEIYSKVVEGFTFLLSEGDLSFKKATDTLVQQGVLKIVEAIPFLDCKNESTFANKPFRYEARFFTGEYLRYRPEGGFDAAELEDCTRQTGECAEVSETCKRLFEQRLPLPRYYFALKDFTPGTKDPDKMVEEELVVEVTTAVFQTTYVVVLSNDIPVSPFAITNAMIQSGLITGASDLVTDQTVDVIDQNGNPRGIYVWGSTWTEISPEVPTFRDMFRFAPGDRASFRNVSEIRSYVALEHVTPLLDLEVYYDNGIFTRSDLSENVKWIDPTYHLESIIFEERYGATSFYRATRSFTPPELRTVWGDSVRASTPRIEEIYGNLLKFVCLATCSEAIVSRLRDNASTVKLGTCQVNLTSKSLGSKTDTYVLENTEYLSQAPAISDFPRSEFAYGPVNYGDGTLAL